MTGPTSPVPHPGPGVPPGGLPTIAVVGPTATGKSDLALLLCERLGGEVVNADAMQFYRGMDIGTAKLRAGERRGIPHHQLDVLDVTQEASVAGYQAAARRDIAGIRSRGAVPVLVGGSGLYVRAALDHLEIPPTDRALRASLESEADQVGAAAMFAQLESADPEAARNIQPNNVRRVVRALEVVHLTGRPFSASMPTREFLGPTVVLGLRLRRDELDARVERRVDRMWEQGLLDEVVGLLDMGLRAGATASRAIGYSQAIAVVDGMIDGDQARVQTVQATRRYSRRQESWFRPDLRISWLEADHPNLLDRALEAVGAHRAGAGTRPSGIPENG